MGVYKQHSIPAPEFRLDKSFSSHSAIGELSEHDDMKATSPLDFKRHISSNIDANNVLLDDVINDMIVAKSPSFSSSNNNLSSMSNVISSQRKARRSMSKGTLSRPSPKSAKHRKSSSSFFRKSAPKMKRVDSQNEKKKIQSVFSANDFFNSSSSPRNTLVPNRSNLQKRK